MTFFQLASIFLQAAGAEPPVVAFVGGGGKTSALFSLAGSLADGGLRVALTTTTLIRDPRRETGRRFDAVVLEKELAECAAPEAAAATPSIGGLVGAGPGVYVVASGPRPGEDRVAGIHPSQVEGLGAVFDAVLVEADGSRELPIKAPAAHEPVVPEGAGLIFGLVGLDCLGKPMDGRTVHRPELFGPLVGCGIGEPLRAIHLRTLAEAPLGLFKGSPRNAVRVLLLNKADAPAPDALGETMEIFSGPPPSGVDAVAVGSFRQNDFRIIAGGNL